MPSQRVSSTYSDSTVGDLQLTRFRNDPSSKGRVLDTGLWRYTRHPNYFGDACVWWGLWLIAAAAGAWWTVLSTALQHFKHVARGGDEDDLEREIKAVAGPPRLVRDLLDYDVV